MLRTLVVLLLLSNLAFFGWMHGWLTPIVGIDPAGEREPQRLKAQVQPQTIRVLGQAPAAAEPPAAPAVAAPAEPPAANATAAASIPGDPAASAVLALNTAAAATPDIPQGVVCLEAGPFTAADVPRLEAALREALPTGTWTLAARERPAQWLAYLGRFNDRDSLRARADELRDQNVRFEELRGAPELEPGISLGRFDREADAREELRRLTLRGVRGGRVVSIAPSAPASYRLRIEQADGLLMAMTLRLKDKLAGKSLGLCPSEAGRG
jgi:hypothetical protein